MVTISNFGIRKPASDLAKDTTGADIVRVMHSEPERHRTGLISVSKSDPEAKALLVGLANAGYYLYRVTDEFSGFIHHRSIHKRPKLTLDGRLSITKDGMMYSVEPPVTNSGPLNLLVVFSSMRTSNALLPRYFFTNFGTIAKYIPQNTAILRIADLGSIKGGFYLNTNYLTNNEANVQTLIKEVAIGLNARKVLLYGTSKGGTAALLHSIIGGHMAVAVDPIISDEYYLTQEMNDEHFTVGTFPETKQVKFERLFAEHLGHPKDDISVIYSERSPQFPYIQSLLAAPYPDSLGYYNSNNPNIEDHPDVAKHTLSLAVSLMSMKLYGLPVARGNYAVV